MALSSQASKSYLSARPIFQQDSRSIPFFISCIILAIQLVYICTGAFKYRATYRENTSIQDRTRYVGGRAIFTFMVTRLIGCVILMGLSFYTTRCSKFNLNDIDSAFRDCPELFLTVTFAYSTFLSIVSLFSTTHGTWSTRYNIILLLSVLVMYIHRDIWPLATYTIRPADNEEGILLPIKIVVLTWISLGVPLFIPRRYTPLDPNNAVPNIEQTASLFSMMTHSFLDHTIMLGYKVPHLSVDQLDPLSDRDAAAYRTQKAFPHIDVFHGAKRRSLFWGLLKVYRKEYVILALTILGYSMGGFAAPIGINRVLYYMETRGAGATIRPWFWTLWLFTGPMIQSFSFQWYIFIATRTLVRAEGLITQLVFEHTLRIRLKAEISKVETASETTTVESISADAKLDNASAVTEATSETSENTEHAATPSQDSTVVPRGPSSASILISSKNMSLSKGKADSEPAASAQEKVASGSNLVGKINNLVTTDLNNVTNARDFLLIIFYLPVQMAFCIIFLYQVLGWSSLVGVATMIVLLPFPGYIANMIQATQRQRMKKTDARVQAVGDTVNILRMIKLFGWEQKMSERLDKTRREELRWLWKLKLLDQFNGLFGALYPTMTMMVSFTLYTVVMKQTLTPSKIFSSITVFSMLREQFYRRLLRHSLIMIQGKVSLKRIEEFLHNTELLDAYLEKPSTDSSAALAPDDEAAATSSSTEIGFRNATFTWSLGAKNDGTITTSNREFKLRIKDEIFFKKNCINLITGPTGSGKTSILMALLGEMHFVPSNAYSWFNLPREGGIAYAAQESWVQNETIRNNILFRTPYNEVRYKKVIKQCALERDLELFEAGDATEVGERGLTLSGGQKARVTLARAIYSHAEILLLDDIFAALDVHTSSHIIENCFKGDLIKGRTILLVTHNIALASPIVDFIVSVGIDGRVKSQGKELSAALKHNPALKQ
ncbi:hypothetical protein CPC08DRAFT_824613, partial [Agrocybe pediades]